MPIKELELPKGAVRTPDADEILRVFINTNKTMDLVLQRGFNDAATWGTLLADIARHAALAYRDFGDDEYRTLERIRDAFVADIAQQRPPGNRF